MTVLPKKKTHKNRLLTSPQPSCDRSRATGDESEMRGVENAGEEGGGGDDRNRVVVSNKGKSHMPLPIPSFFDLG